MTEPRGDRDRAPREGRRGLVAALVNVGLALLSLVVAVVIWVLITNSQNPPDARNVYPRLEVVSVPRGYVISSITHERATVRLTGPLNVLPKVREDDVVAQVNLSGTETDDPAQSEFSVRRPVTVKVGGRHADRVRAEPSAEEVEVRLEKQERKPIPVRVTQVGVLPVGYELADITLDPPMPTAVVVGAPRNLAAIEVVSADVRVDVSTVSATQQVTLEARDSSGRTIGGVTVQPATVIARVSVRQTLFEKQVAVNVQWRGRPRTGYTVTSVHAEPAFVTVVGTLDQINALTSVMTEVVDLEGAAEDVSQSVPLQLQGVTSRQPTCRDRRALSCVVVRIGLQVVRAPGSVGVVPRVVNTPPGLIASLTTPIVALNVSGPLGDLAGLRPTDVSVTVDVTGLKAGTHSLEPRVVLPPALQLDAVVPEKVEVVLTPVPR